MSQKKIFLTSPAVFLKEEEGDKKSSKGHVKGVAYTGSLIKNHGFIQNLIVDLSSLTIARESTPIFFNHDPSDPIGKAAVEVDKDGFQVLIDGEVFDVTESGKKVRTLSDAGYEWQLSIGIFDGTEEVVDKETVNGVEVENATVIRGAVLREVSIVTLGADEHTKVEVLENKGAKEMFMTKEEWVKFACACGGDKNSKPKDLQAKFQSMEEAEEKVEELEEKVEALETENKEAEVKVEALEGEVEELEEKVEELVEEIEEIKEEVVREEREEELRAKVAQVGLKISDRKIREAAKTSTGFKVLMSFIGDAQPASKKKASETFTKKVSLGGGGSGTQDAATQIALAADALVKEGKAKDFMEALEMVEG